MPDANHLVNNITGTTYVNSPGTGWIDAKTGAPAPLGPPGWLPNGASSSDLTGGRIYMPDANHLVNNITGVTYVRVPCPQPTTQTSSTGLFLGGELVKNWGWVRSTETFAATGTVTNRFTDRADPIGGGILVGYTFAPWNNNIFVSPFASFDYVNAPVNHTFANGSYLGTTANFVATAGVKAGARFDAGFSLYGIAGVSLLDETLNVHFTPSSAKDVIVPGLTLGLGGAIQPAFLQGFGRPVSLFLEYQHSWWQSATFGTPAASPFFNYRFQRQDDTIKLGFTISFGAGP